MDVSPAWPSSRTRPLRPGRCQYGWHSRRPGRSGPAGTGPVPPGHRARTRPVHPPRPATRLCCRAGPYPRQRGRTPGSGPPGARPLPAYRPRWRCAAPPARDEVTPAPAEPVVVPEYLADHCQALAWYEAEHTVLLAAIALAADAGFDTHAWQLPWTLVTFLYRTGRWHEWTSLQRSALEAATRLGDHNAQARSLLDLGYACAVRACYDDAHRHLRRALSLFRQLDDQVGQARAHNALAMALEGQGRQAEALDHAKTSLDLYTAAGNPAAQANALTELGWLQASSATITRRS